MIQNQINIVIRTLKPETAAFIRDQTSNFSPTGKRIEVYNYIWAKFYESTKRDSIYYELRNSLQPLLRTGVDYEYSIEQYNWDEFYPDYALGERTATFTSGFRNTGAVISGAFVNTGYALLGSVFNMTGDGSWYDMRKSASGQGIQSLGSTIATGWNQGVEYLGDAAINATLPPAQAAVVAKAKADAKAADAEKAAEAAKAAAKEAEEKRRRTRI
jgi:hypothetical protein